MLGHALTMTFPASQYTRLGRYELISLLARGGMAEVYLARVTGAGGFARQLVIKRILPQLVEDPEFIAMFLDEARIAARLTHPNVCQVYELGEVDGSLFLAMEYLDGLSWAELAPLVPRDGAFELACAAGVLGQICHALRYAHELCAPDGTPTPVVHRDVSPHNLMVTRDGACKLLDFGVSKVLTEGSRTRTGMIKGKLPYMAPEQIRGEPVDPRADVFSLGVVLWEALTGERLFRRDTDYQIWHAVTEEEIPSVSSRAPRLPAAVDAVVARALERDRDERYASVAEFAAALDDLARAVSGPLSTPALAELVQTVGAAQLARRAKLVLAAQRPDAPVVTPAQADARHGGLPVRLTARGMSATRSLRLRSGLVAIGKHARRRWRRVAAAAVLVVGAACGFAAARVVSDAGDGALDTAARAAAADVAPAVATDVAPAVATDMAPAPARAPELAEVTTAAAPVTFPQTAPATLPLTPPATLPLTPPATLPPTPPATLPPTPPASTKDRASADRPPAPAGDRRRRPRARTARAPDAASVAAPGHYSVDSRPYAEIFIDGKSYGETPLFKVALAPGKHAVRAVRADGRIQRHTITIDPGKLTSSGTLTW